MPAKESDHDHQSHSDFGQARTPRDISRPGMKRTALRFVPATRFLNAPEKTMNNDSNGIALPYTLPAIGGNPGNTPGTTNPGPLFDTNPAGNP